MTKKELVKVIREVVKREVKSVVEKEINEVLNILEQKKTKPGAMSLTEALNETKENDGWKTMGSFDSKDARARFASMQGGNAPVRNNLLDQPQVQQDESLQNAFTRDYSDLVKRFKK